MKRFAVLSITLLALSACASMSDAPNPSEAEIAKAQLKYDKAREKAVRRLIHLSDARKVSDGRVEIEARGALGRGIQKVEDTFLIRASAAAVESGYDGFTISYLTYESQFPYSMSNGLTSFPEVVDIGSYEEFLAYSKEQRILLSATAMSFKRISGVIVLRNDEDQSGEYFSADELYENFIMAYRSN